MIFFKRLTKEQRFWFKFFRYGQGRSRREARRLALKIAPAPLVLTAGFEPTFPRPQRGVLNH
jgi:hypothetical protein